MQAEGSLRFVVPKKPKKGSESKTATKESISNTTL